MVADFEFAKHWSLSSNATLLSALKVQVRSRSGAT
jgi:hypothetical protein